MLELGEVLGFFFADSSSASKGESVADTARVIECYADTCDASSKGRSTICSVTEEEYPCDQCRGDGGHNHPNRH